MIKGIHHVAIVVRDLAAAERFYGAAAAMQTLPVRAAEALCPAAPELIVPGDTLHRCAVMAGRNFYLELIAQDWPAGLPAVLPNPINRAGIRHFCAQSHDCSILEQAVEATGGSLIAPPLDLGTGNQYAYARDGEGNIMEIEGLPYAPPGEPTWLGHVAIVTRDMDAATGFYSALLGTELKSRSRVGPGPQFDRMGGLTGVELEGAWLPAGNLQLELWQFHVPASPVEPVARQFLDPGYSHICLESDRIEADLARLTDLGGSVLTGCVENDAIRTAFACDPEGNVIELLEPRRADGPLSIAALADPAICNRIGAGRRPDPRGSLRGAVNGS